jgi:branched-chain amino acid transport system permease protein
VAPNRIASWPRAAAAGVALVALIWFVTASLAESNVTRLELGIATALVMLSLVPLVGYGGQVSLCQMTFAGIGAFLVSKWGVHGEPWAFLAAAVVTGIVGALVALPALRLQGLYLALSTMAFALLAERVFFSDSRVFGAAGTAEIARFDVPGVSLASERAHAVFLAVVFALLGFAVVALRRSRLGRRLIAMKDSPAACATLGMNLQWTKLALFGFSAALAGFAGALYGGVNQSAGTNDFVMLQSLVVLLPVVIWSISTASGALVGGLSLAMLLPMVAEKFPWLPAELPLLATGLGAVGLGRRPDGVILDASQRLHAEVQSARDAAEAESQLVGGLSREFA